MQIPTVEKCCCGCSLRTGSALVGILFFISCLNNTISFTRQAEYAEANNDAFNRAACISSAVVSAVMLACSCLLLFGVQTERAWLLKPWLLVNSVLGFLLTIIFLMVAIMCFADDKEDIGFVLLVVGFVYSVLWAYFVVVVYSYHLQLKDMQIAQPHESLNLKSIP